MKKSLTIKSYSGREHPAGGLRSPIASRRHRRRLDGSAASTSWSWRSFVAQRLCELPLAGRRRRLLLRPPRGRTATRGHPGRVCGKVRSKQRRQTRDLRRRRDPPSAAPRKRCAPADCGASSGDGCAPTAPTAASPSELTRAHALTQRPVRARHHRNDSIPTRVSGGTHAEPVRGANLSAQCITNIELPLSGTQVLQPCRCATRNGSASTAGAGAAEIPS